MQPPRPSYASDAGILDRALGAYLGFAVGDALGATVEFMTPAEIARQYGVHTRMIGGGWLKLEAGQVTDDTEMTLCVGRAIVLSAGWDLKAVCDEFAHWLKRVPVDVGNTVRRGIRRYIVDGTMTAPPNDGDAGNGACMPRHPQSPAVGRGVARSLPHGAAAGTGRRRHRLPGGGEGAHRGAPRLPLRALSRALLRLYRRYRPHRAEELLPDRFDPHLRHRDGNMGGDADTAGALAGMLAGATYGAATLPDGWLRRLDPAVGEEIAAQVPQLLAIADRRAAGD